MPELPEVETICRGLSPVLEGAVIEDVIIRQFKLRIPVPNDFRQKLLLRKVTKVQRRAKYLLIELNDGGIVIGHLGMSGRLRLINNNKFFKLCCACCNEFFVIAKSLNLSLRKGNESPTYVLGFKSVSKADIYYPFLSIAFIKSE